MTGSYLITVTEYIRYSMVIHINELNFDKTLHFALLLPLDLLACWEMHSVIIIMYAV